MLMRMNLKTIAYDTTKVHYSALRLKSLNSSALLANSAKKLFHPNTESPACMLRENSTFRSFYK